MTALWAILSKFLPDWLVGDVASQLVKIVALLILDAVLAFFVVRGIVAAPKAAWVLVTVALTAGAWEALRLYKQANP